MRNIYFIIIMLCGMLPIRAVDALDIPTSKALFAGKYSTRTTEIIPDPHYSVTCATEPDYRYIGDHNVVPTRSTYRDAQYRYYYQVRRPHESSEFKYLTIDLDMNSIMIDEFTSPVPFREATLPLNYKKFMEQLGK